MKQSTSEQQLIFAEIFNRVTYMHQFVVGESNTLYSFLYNLMACITVFLLTSTPRTAGARLVLFVLIAINFYLERIICNSVLENTKPSYEQTEAITFRIGLLRKIITAAGFLILAYFTLTYKDVTKQSLRILSNLQETQLKMQDFLRETEKLLTSPVAPPSSQWLNRDNACCTDSGITEDVLVTPTCTMDDLIPSRLFDAVYMEKFTTSTPRKRKNSGSRRQNNRRSASIIYSVPVSEEEIPRYNLRTRKSGDTLLNVTQGRGNRGPLSMEK